MFGAAFLPDGVDYVLVDSRNHSTIFNCVKLKIMPFLLPRYTLQMLSYN